MNQTKSGVSESEVPVRKGMLITGLFNSFKYFRNYNLDSSGCAYKSTRLQQLLRGPLDKVQIPYNIWRVKTTLQVLMDWAKDYFPGTRVETHVMNKLIGCQQYAISHGFLCFNI